MNLRQLLVISVALTLTHVECFPLYNVLKAGDIAYVCAKEVPSSKACWDFIASNNLRGFKLGIVVGRTKDHIKVLTCKDDRKSLPYHASPQNFPPVPSTAINVSGTRNCGVTLTTRPCPCVLRRCDHPEEVEFDRRAVKAGPRVFRAPGYLRKYYDALQAPEFKFTAYIGKLEGKILAHDLDAVANTKKMLGDAMGSCTDGGVAKVRHLKQVEDQAKLDFGELYLSQKYKESLVAFDLQQEKKKKREAIRQYMSFARNLRSINGLVHDIQRAISASQATSSSELCVMPEDTPAEVQEQIRKLRTERSAERSQEHLDILSGFGGLSLGLVMIAADLGVPGVGSVLAASAAASEKSAQVLLAVAEQVPGVEKTARAVEHLQRLQEQASDAAALPSLTETAGVGGRAGEVLGSAEEAAREVLGEAAQEAAENKMDEWKEKTPKQLWTHVVMETSGLVYAVRDALVEASPEALQGAAVEGFWATVSFFPLVGGYMGVVRSAGELFVTLKEARASQDSYEEERDRLASTILGMRDCSIATVQLADVREEERIETDSRRLDMLIPVDADEDVRRSSTEIRRGRRGGGSKPARPKAARPTVENDTDQAACSGWFCSIPKPEKKENKAHHLYRRQNLAVTQRSKEGLLAAAARLGKRIVELRGALEGAVAARSANSHIRQALKKVSHSDMMAVGFSGLISHRGSIRQTLEDTHVVRKTPSDLLNPVEWEATVGEAIRAGCEAFNALGIEGPQMQCD